MDAGAIIAGLIAYIVSVLAAVLLVFFTYRLNNIVTSKVDEERFLIQGNRSIAISLGAVVLSQAILMRHAVFPAMAVIRDLFVAPPSLAAASWVVAQCIVFFVIVSILSFGSVYAASWMFTRMTRNVPEHEEIQKDNVAVGIFYAFVILAITLIVNEGLEDLSRSLIPYNKSGMIQIE
jgi:uncharacterized membrane protein YjfL (UPF0719 family)